MEILFILENSWFNYIGDQRKSSKNETTYIAAISRIKNWAKVVKFREHEISLTVVLSIIIYNIISYSRMAF